MVDVLELNSQVWWNGIPSTIVEIMDSDCEEDLSDLNYAIVFNHCDKHAQGWYDVMVLHSEVYVMSKMDIDKFGRKDNILKDS